MTKYTGGSSDFLGFVTSGKRQGTKNEKTRGEKRERLRRTEGN